MQQTKSLLEESKKENTTLKERIVKLEVDQELNQTSVSRFTEITQQLKREIVQVKEMLEHYDIRTTHFLWTLQGRQQLLQKAIQIN